MNTIYFDSTFDDQKRRQELYKGQFFAYSPSPSSLAMCEFAREMIQQAFGSLDPLTAQQHMPVEQYAAILAELKPKFIHHPESKRLIKGILEERGCDLEKTYFDVPRMRTATSDNYLVSGIAYAFHPHRDTWYSAPFCQLNWWFPIYDIVSENSMAFHPRYWGEPVKNGSRDYNYQEWNKEGRKVAAEQIKTDTRKQPKPEEPVELDSQIRLIAKPGGIIIFSAAHLHSTVPNTAGITRYSIDFRTVHLDDARNFVGAPNVDSECTGTTIQDYLRGSDHVHLPDEVIKLHEHKMRKIEVAAV